MRGRFSQVPLQRTTATFGSVLATAIPKRSATLPITSAPPTGHISPSIEPASAPFTRAAAIPEHPAKPQPPQLAPGRISPTWPKRGSLSTGQLKEGEGYDVDFDHQFIEAEKFDAKPTYKKFLGYRPGVAVIGDMIVGIENSDGNTNVRFHQKDTLRRFFERIEQKGLTVNRFRADCGSCSEEIVEEVGKHCMTFYIRANRCGSLYDDIFALRGWKREELGGIEFELNSILVEKWKGRAYRLVIQRQKRIDGEIDLWEGEYTYRCILTNDYESSEKEIVKFYNLRGGKERIFDEMNNGFGWNRLPKSFMGENTVFLLLTALIRNFYKFIMARLDVKRFGLKATSRIKAFVFKFISVPAKWVRTSRQYVLNIYSCNNAYADVFQNDFG